MDRLQQINEILHDLKQFVKCPVCNDFVKNGVELECEHLYCKKCVETLVKNRPKDSYCVKCNKIIKMVAPSLDSYPSDLVEFLAEYEAEVAKWVNVTVTPSRFGKRVTAAKKTVAEDLFDSLCKVRTYRGPKKVQEDLQQLAGVANSDVAKWLTDKNNKFDRITQTQGITNLTENSDTSGDEVPSASQSVGLINDSKKRAFPADKKREKFCKKDTPKPRLTVEEIRKKHCPNLLVDKDFVVRGVSDLEDEDVEDTRRKSPRFHRRKDTSSRVRRQSAKLVTSHKEINSSPENSSKDSRKWVQPISAKSRERHKKITPEKLDITTDKIKNNLFVNLSKNNTLDSPEKMDICKISEAKVSKSLEKCPETPEIACNSFDALESVEESNQKTESSEKRLKTRKKLKITTKKVQDNLLVDMSKNNTVESPEKIDKTPEKTSNSEIYLAETEKLLPEVDNSKLEIDLTLNFEVSNESSDVLSELKKVEVQLNHLIKQLELNGNYPKKIINFLENILPSLDNIKSLCQNDKIHKGIPKINDLLSESFTSCKSKVSPDLIKEKSDQGFSDSLNLADFETQTIINKSRLKSPEKQKSLSNDDIIVASFESLKNKRIRNENCESDSEKPHKKAKRNIENDISVKFDSESENVEFYDAFLDKVLERYKSNEGTKEVVKVMVHKDASDNVNKFSESLFSPELISVQEKTLQFEANKVVEKALETQPEIEDELGKIDWTPDKSETNNSSKEKCKILGNVLVKPAIQSDEDEDIIESTPQKERFCRSPVSGFQEPLPPPAGFEDDDKDTFTNDITLLETNPQKEKLQNIVSMNQINDILQNSEEKISPISKGKNQNVFQRSDSPLMTVKSGSLSGNILTSTPKQKSILNFVESKKNKKPCIACTRLSKEQVIEISKLTNRKLANYSTIYGPEVTHMIVSTNQDNHARDLTMKYVSAVASGIWVLNFQWVQDCLKNNRIVPEEPYEVLDEHGGPGPKSSRLKGDKSGLLTGFTFYCSTPFTTTKDHEVYRLIKCLGGQLADSVLELGKQAPKSYCMVISETNSSLDFERYENWLDKYKVISVDIDWLSHSIGQYTLLNVRPFLLCSDSTIEELNYPSNLIGEVSQTCTDI